MPEKDPTTWWARHVDAGPRHGFRRWRRELVRKGKLGHSNGTPVFSYPQALDGNVTITLHRSSGSNSMSFPITITELYSGLTFSTTLNLSFAG